MAVFQIEDGIATGRGFSGIDANGICARFRTWVTTVPVSGGPGWFIIDDYSANVPVNFAPSDVNTSNDQITITAHGFSHGHIIRFSTTTTAPSPLVNNTTYYVIFVDANTIKLATTFNNAMAGTAIDLTTQGSGTHTITPLEYFIIVSDANAASVNSYNGGAGGGAPKYIKFGYTVTNAGYISIHGLLYWDTSLRRGRVYWTGRELATYDAADFVYSFRGGAEQMMIVTRTGTLWNYILIDDYVGDPNLVEPASAVGVLQSGASAGSLVEVQLALGEAANFTINNFYFIYDFTATTTGTNATQVNYVKVTAVDTINDRIIIETLTNNFNSGAVISAYAHRFYSIGDSRSTFGYSPSVIGLDDTYSYGPYARMPYYSCPVGQSCYRAQGNNVSSDGVRTEYLSNVISTMAPDDRGNYAAQRPTLAEYANPNGSANRAYGITKNAYASAAGTASAWLDYRVVGGRQWLYAGTVSFPRFFLNTESLV